MAPRLGSGAVVEISRRTSGALTSSRVAGRMGRWPAEQAMRAVLTDPRIHGWTMPHGPPHVYASYIDNLNGVVSTAAEVATAMQVSRAEVQREWRLGFKKRSGQMDVSRGAPEVQVPPAGANSNGDYWNVTGWTASRPMSVLGHQFAWDGVSTNCWHRAAAGRASFGHSSARR